LPHAVIVLDCYQCTSYKWLLCTIIPYEGVDSSHLAQIKNRLWACVSILMNLRVP